MTSPTPSTPARDYLTSLARTWVPISWGALISWLVGGGWIDQATADQATGLGAGLAVLAVAVVGAVYYAVARLLEPQIMKIPTVGPLIVRLLLGSTAAPVYQAAAGRHSQE